MKQQKRENKGKKNEEAMDELSKISSNISQQGLFAPPPHTHTHFRDC